MFFENMLGLNGPMSVVVWMILIVSLAFELVNGFHDTANATATIIGTRVLKRIVAITFTSVLNLAGAMLVGTAVAKTIGNDMVVVTYMNEGIIFCGVTAGLTWNLLTYWLKLPTSSSQALIGGILGAVVINAGFIAIKYLGVLKMAVGLFLVPTLSFFGACFMMVALQWFVILVQCVLNWVVSILLMLPPSMVPVRQSKLLKLRARGGGIFRTSLDRWFRGLQVVSAGFVAFSHGSNDAQKTMGILTLTFGLAALQDKAADGSAPVLYSVMVLCAVVMFVGTQMGGSRVTASVIKIVELDPSRGFVAESFSASMILLSTFFGLPVSTTHTLSSAVAGTGWSAGSGGVRWLLVIRILWAWALTIPCSAAVGMLLMLIRKLLS